MTSHASNPPISVQNVLVFLLICVALLALNGSAAAQGQILRPATTPLLDPNQDGWATTSGGPFQSNEVTESELPFAALPQAQNEPAGDADAQSCSRFDGQDRPGSNGQAHFYGLLNPNGLPNDGDEQFLFRIRLGQNPAQNAFGFSILLDTDLAFRADDPNSGLGNRGYEREIRIVNAGNDKGIYLDDVDGRIVGQTLRTYSLEGHSQVVRALHTNSSCQGQNPVFYDIALPLNELGLGTNNNFRLNSATSESGGSVLLGNAADMTGQDDDEAFLGGFFDILFQDFFHTNAINTQGDEGLPPDPAAEESLTLSPNTVQVPNFAGDTSSARSITLSWADLVFDKQVELFDAQPNAYRVQFKLQGQPFQDTLKTSLSRDGNQSIQIRVITQAEGPFALADELQFRKAADTSLKATASLEGAEVPLVAVSDGSFAAANTWDLGQVPTSDARVVVRNHALTLNQSASAQKILVEDQACLSLANGSSLSTAEGLTLEKGASLINDAGAQINGPVRYRHFFDFENHSRGYYIGSPLQGATSAALSGSTEQLFLWDETGPGWTSVSDNSTPLPAMRGFAYKAASSSPDTATVTMTGSPLAQAQTFAFSQSGQYKSGFALVANPFSAPLSYLHPANTQDSLTPTFWYRTDGQFATYNTEMQVGTNGATDTVPLAQAFWIRLATGAQQGSLTLSPEARTCASPTFLKKGKETRRLLRITAQRNEYQDENVLLWDSTATDSFNTKDSEKMLNSSDSLPNLYTKMDNKMLAIQSRDTLQWNETQSIPIYLATSASGPFTLRLRGLQSMEHTQLYLKDHQTKKLHSLTADTAIHFQQVANEKASDSAKNRFTLRLRKNSKPLITSLENPKKTSWQMTNRPDALWLESASPETFHYQLFAASGQLIRAGQGTGPSFRLPKGSLAPGTYLLQIAGKDYSQTIRFLR